MLIDYLPVSRIWVASTSSQSPVERGNIDCLLGSCQQAAPSIIGREVRGWPRGVGQVLWNALYNAQTVCMQVAMPDVQKFFYKLAVIFAKVQYLYFRRKLSASSIEWYHFPVVHSMYAQVHFFPMQTSIEQKCKHVLLVLHRFVRH